MTKTRRIFAVLLAIFVIANTVFWIAYGVFEPWRIIVNGLVFDIIGPTAYNTLSGTVTWVISVIGISGLVAIVAIPVFILGIVTHMYWVKADWTLRRWASNRTATQLGTTTVTHLPSTPPGATTRPPVASTPTLSEPPKIVQEETKSEEQTQK